MQKSITQLHSLLLHCNLLTAHDCFFANRLVSSYAKLTSYSLACKLFDEISHPNYFLWNAILRAHCRAQQWVEALRLIRCMNAKPSDLDAFTLPIILKACAALSALLHGLAIHAKVVIRDANFISDVYVAAALVEMYAKCGEMDDSLKVFKGFKEPDVVLWTKVVSGYQQNGNAEQAIAFFHRMVVEKCVILDPVTLVSVVTTLGQLGDLRGGRCFHEFLLRMGFGHDTSLANSILNIYSKIGAVRTARMLFEVMPWRDVITWSCMISCYAHNSELIAALKVYRKMVDMGVEPNSVTMANTLQVYSLSCDLQEGRRLHEISTEMGFDLDKSVATSLIDMYMNCACYKEAIGMFYRMPKKDDVTWASTIDGCAKNGYFNESLKIFKMVLLDKVSPNAVTMVKVLVACSHMVVLCQAHYFHGYLIRCGFSDKVFIGAALVDLYSKCGCLDNAVRIFEGMSEKDVVL